jgi:anti-sigma B factor antagonist
MAQRSRFETSGRVDAEADEEAFSSPLGRGGLGSGMSASRPDPITTLAHRRNGVWVLVVRGEIDAATAPVFEEAVADVLSRDAASLIIDLSDVTFLGSAGLRILVATHELVSRAADFAVVADSPETCRPIELMDLDKVFALYPSTDDALAAMRLKAE